MHLKHYRRGTRYDVAAFLIQRRYRFARTRKALSVLRVHSVNLSNTIFRGSPRPRFAPPGWLTARAKREHLLHTPTFRFGKYTETQYVHFFGISPPIGERLCVPCHASFSRRRSMTYASWLLRVCTRLSFDLIKIGANSTMPSDVPRYYRHMDEVFTDSYFFSFTLRMHINGGLATMCNIVSIWLILFRSSRSMGTYKWFLLNVTVSLAHT